VKFRGGISKRVVVQGGLVKFPLFFFFFFLAKGRSHRSIVIILPQRDHSNTYWLEPHIRGLDCGNYIHFFKSN
jgi:hypothetical protein